MVNRAAHLSLAGLLTFTAACGPKTLQARLANAERRATNAEGELDEAERRLDELSPDPAQGRLEAARRSLADPDVAYYPERELLRNRLAELEGRLAAVREEVKRRELQRAVAERRENVAQAVTRLRRALVALESELTRERFSDARDAQNDVVREVKEGKDLEARDEAYAEYARHILDSSQQSAKDLARLELELTTRERRARIEERKEHLDKAMASLRKARSTQEQVGEARDHQRHLARELKEADELAKKDAGFAEYLKAAREALSRQEEEIEKRSLAIAVGDQRKKLSEAAGQAKRELSAAQRPPAERGKWDRAKDAARRLEEVLKEGAQLSQKDRGYEQVAKAAKDQVEAAERELKAIDRALEFADGPARERQRGLELAKEARAQKDKARARALYGEASQEFRTCARRAKELLAPVPAAARVKVRVEGRVTTPQDLASDCDKREQDVATAVAGLNKPRAAPSRVSARSAKSR